MRRKATPPYDDLNSLLSQPFEPNDTAHVYLSGITGRLQQLDGMHFQSMELNESDYKARVVSYEARYPTFANSEPWLLDLRVVRCA